MTDEKELLATVDEIKGQLLDIAYRIASIQIWLEGFEVSCEEFEDDHAPFDVHDLYRDKQWDH